jgi:hypothetical protein
VLFKEVESKEEELLREWDWRPGRPEAEEWEREERCCVNGLEVCCISWKEN